MLGKFTQFGEELPLVQKFYNPHLYFPVLQTRWFSAETQAAYRKQHETVKIHRLVQVWVSVLRFFGCMTLSTLLDLPDIQPPQSEQGPKLTFCEVRVRMTCLLSLQHSVQIAAKAQKKTFPYCSPNTMASWAAQHGKGPLWVLSQAQASRGLRSPLRSPIPLLTASRTAGKRQGYATRSVHPRYHPWKESQALGGPLKSPQSSVLSDVIALDALEYTEGFFSSQFFLCLRLPLSLPFLST